MQVVISQKDINVSPSVEEYIRNKTQKLMKFSKYIQEIRVVCQVKDKQAAVEMIVDIEHGDDLVSEVKSDDLMASTDMVVDKLSAQLEKLHSKLVDHSKREPLKKTPADLPGDGPV